MDPTGFQPFKLFHISQNANQDDQTNLSQDIPVVSDKHLLHPLENGKLPPMKIIGHNKITIE